jgi:hypothetical protein
MSEYPQKLRLGSFKDNINPCVDEGLSKDMRWIAVLFVTELSINMVGLPEDPTLPLKYPGDPEQESLKIVDWSSKTLSTGSTRSSPSSPLPAPLSAL